MLCNKKRIAHKQLVYRRFKRTLVLEAGLEPAQPQWPKDFKSFVPGHHSSILIAINQHITYFTFTNITTWFTYWFTSTM